MVTFTFWVILKRRLGGNQTGMDSPPRPRWPRADKNKGIKKKTHLGAVPDPDSRNKFSTKKLQQGRKVSIVGCWGN